MMVDAEKPKELKSWAERWEAADAKFEAAKGMLDGYKDIQANQFEGVRVDRRWLSNVFTETIDAADVSIGLKPKPEEITAAPKAVQRVLKDIGIEPTDEVFVELKIDRPYLPVRNFKVTINPNYQAMTDNKFGITLATNHYGDEVIAPTDIAPHGIAPHKLVREHPIFASEEYISDKLGPKASVIRKSYGSMRDIMDDETKLESRIHPDKRKIMTGLAKWVSKLLEARRRQPQGQPQVKS